MKRNRIINAFFAMTLVVGALILIQVCIGCLVRRTVPLQSGWIKERQEHALRFSLPESMRPPPRFASMERLPSFFTFQSYVSLNELRLERNLSKKDVSTSPVPCFAWTQNNLWVGLGKDQNLEMTEGHLVVVMPRPVPLPLWLAAALLPLIGWFTLSKSARQSHKEFLMCVTLAFCARLRKTPLDGAASRGATPWTKCLVVATVILLAAVVGADHGRPLWYDELMHFGLGACKNTAEAWNTIYEIGKTPFKSGQTGIYELLDYWLLKLFGASLFALRLPSTGSSILLFLGAVHFLRARGFGTPWNIVVIFALTAQVSLVYYMAEARPYMPLAAAAVGILAYYVSPSALRQTPWVRALGAVSIGWGVLMHPYFSVYWLMSYFFGLWLAVRDGQMRLNLGSMFRFASPAVSLAGMAVYFTLAKLMWMHSMDDFQQASFTGVSHDAFWPMFINGTHFQFLCSSIIRLSVLALVLGGLLTCGLSRKARQSLDCFLPPLVLIAVSMLASLLIAWISNKHHYAVVPRQWIASQAVIPIAFIWMLAELFNRFSPRFAIPSLVALGLLLTPVFDQALSSGKSNFVLTMANLRNISHVDPTVIPERKNAATMQLKTEWVALANQNIRAGGAVWPEFQFFYANALARVRSDRLTKELNR